MKNRINYILCLALILIFCTNANAQEQNIPAKKQEKSSVTKNNQNKVTDAPPPPPPPPKRIIEEEIFKVVEEMPRFPGCEDQGLSRGELSSCAKELLVQYIQDNLIYPEHAKKNGIEGMAVIQLVIGKDGSILDPKIVRDPGGGYEDQASCGQAALNVFTKMQSEIKWIAGKQRGRPVKVQYTIPVKFKL